jgi:hypothetical protein
MRLPSGTIVTIITTNVVNFRSQDKRQNYLGRNALIVLAPISKIIPKTNKRLPVFVHWVCPDIALPCKTLLPCNTQTEPISIEIMLKTLRKILISHLQQNSTDLSVIKLIKEQDN